MGAEIAPITLGKGTNSLEANLINVLLENKYVEIFLLRVERKTIMD